MYHYVYNLIGEDFRFYIGRRSCKCHPTEDTKYLGSFTDKTFKPIIKQILCIFDDISNASRLEHELHKEFKVDINPMFVNRNIATKQGKCSFSYGYKHTEKAKENYKKSNKGKNKGIPKTPQTKAKLKESCTKVWESEEYKTKMKLKFKNRICTEEGKLKRRQKYQKRKENGYRQPLEKKYLFLDPEGLHIEMFLSDCHKYNLTKSAICNLANHPEKHKIHKGWRVIGCVIG